VTALEPYRPIFIGITRACGTCPIVVKKALERVPGVTSTSVDFDKKTATVTFDPDKATSAKLTQATTEAGFPSNFCSPMGSRILTPGQVDDPDIYNDYGRFI
jgi:mercuric ion binding protein